MINGKQIEIAIFCIALLILTYLIVNFWVVPMSIFKYLIIDAIISGSYYLVQYVKKQRK